MDSYHYFSLLWTPHAVCILLIVISSLIEVDNSAVEDLRHQHLYRPIAIEQKCPALANVLNQISAGLFGDSGVYET